MNSRGYAIAAVLLISTVLMSAAIRLSLSIHAESRLAAAQLNRLQLRTAALSGIEIGRWLLEQDSHETDGVTDNWATERRIEIEGVHLSISISDEQSRINAAKFVYESGELNQPLWTLAKGIFPEIRSGSSDIEQFLRTRWARHSIAFMSPGQLRSAPGLSGSKAPADMTVFGNGLININSSDDSILGALFGDRAGFEIARRIVSERSTLAFRSVFDMKERIDLTAEEFRRVFALICVNSSWYRIRVDGEIGDTRHSMEAIVQRSNESTRVIRFREWSR